jgi:thiol-disulfide isomerase/thioredoxin
MRTWRPTRTIVSWASRIGACAIVALTASASPPNQIAWFAGGVDAAFAGAKASGRPVFLYWGAVWCPPCQQLKATVFPRPDFIAKTRQFVAVYLDGDAPSAQKWGETFRISGYPTLLVLDSHGKETQRISGGLDLGAYAEVLDLALADLQPVNALLDAAVTGKALSMTQCRRLAFNAWGLELVEQKDLSAYADRLQSAAMACPAAATVERARLSATSARFAANAKRADLGAAVESVATIVANRALATQLSDALGFPDEFFAAVKQLGADKAGRFAADYATVMDAASNDAKFADADRLDALAYKLRALRMIGATADLAAARADARKRLTEALARRSNAYVRASVVNSALHVYDELNDAQAAYDLVKGEIATAHAPYYYKADLADLAEALGRKDEAVKLLADAYAESKGTATRFQWGENYLSALLRLRPDDEKRIRAVGAQVLAELKGPDRIYRRARTRLESLDKALRDWDAAAHGRHGAVLRDLRADMQATCRQIPSGEAARKSCEAFLAGRT